jgi:hypothetical protein
MPAMSPRRPVAVGIDGRHDPAGGRLATLRQMRTRASQLAASPPAVLAQHAPLRANSGAGEPAGLMGDARGRGPTAMSARGTRVGRSRTVALRTRRPVWTGRARCAFMP